MTRDEMRERAAEAWLAVVAQVGTDQHPVEHILSAMEDAVRESEAVRLLREINDHTCTRYCNEGPRGVCDFRDDLRAFLATLDTPEQEPQP